MRRKKQKNNVKLLKPKNRLSKSASTVHSTYVVPIKGVQQYVHPAHKNYAILKQAEVHLIDEVSMLTSEVVDSIMTTLRRIHNCSSNEELLEKIIIVFVGDHAQLPPVCKHFVEDSGSVCEACHIVFSIWWEHYMQIRELQCQPRFSDAVFAEFLNICRARMPTRDEYKATIGDVCRHVTKEEAKRMIGEEGARAICSHLEDVGVYNDEAISNLFEEDKIVDIELETNAENVPRMKKWVEDVRFHSLRKVAVGARVAITTNMLENGIANGTTGVVTGIEFSVNEEDQDDEAVESRRGQKVIWDGTTRKPSGFPLTIFVKVDKTDEDEPDKVVKIKQTSWAYEYEESRTYFKKTFPLILCYAMTGHRCQGGTIKSPTKVIIDIKDAFLPGLLYVIISRVECRDQICIVGKLTHDMFKPIILRRSL